MRYNGEMVLACTQHDPEGRMTDQTYRVFDKLNKIFSQIYIAPTLQTDAKQITFLKQKGVKIIPGGEWARAYNRLLSAFNNSQTTEPLLITGWDKILHWTEENIKELIVMSKIDPKGLMIAGRTKKAWRSYPKSWTETERLGNVLANRYFRKNNWDWLTGNFIINKRAASYLADQGIQEMDQLFIWPKIIINKKLKLEYRSFDGFSFEDPDRFTKEIKKLGLRKWKTKNYDSLPEWQKRVDNLRVFIKALKKAWNIQKTNSKIY